MPARRGEDIQYHLADTALRDDADTSRRVRSFGMRPLTLLVAGPNLDRLNCGR